MKQIQTKFSEQLIAWQKTSGRHNLPWQNTQDAYRVWLSEVMLQQTQVATVKDYYLRFLKHYPSIEALALASVDDVLSLWSGLGYYTRARNLHGCAQTIVGHHGGRFPQTLKELMQLPGIGRSTAAAIAAFCFNQRVSILDGNVKRVLTRVLAYEGDISKSVSDKELWEIAQSLLPTESYISGHQNTQRNAHTHVHAPVMASYTQGLMDLGATVCLPRQTHCMLCPMQNICQAHLQKRELDFPHKTQKLKRSVRSGYVLCLTSPLGVWLVKRPAKGIWGGLYSMPVFETHEEREGVIKILQVQQVQELPTFKHVLTHLDWMLQPTVVRLSKKQAQVLPQDFTQMQGQWFDLQGSLALGLPAPIKRLLEADI